MRYKSATNELKVVQDRRGGFEKLYKSATDDLKVVQKRR